ncbi:MAG: hypothetical protein JOZ15_01400, partial [Acidobacteria bacterium]|nr:hypothetical protein [Acidobacteriota bacterium]
SAAAAAAAATSPRIALSLPLPALVHDRHHLDRRSMGGVLHENPDRLPPL